MDVLLAASPPVVSLIFRFEADFRVERTVIQPEVASSTVASYPIESGGLLPAVGRSESIPSSVHILLAASPLATPLVFFFEGVFEPRDETTPPAAVLSLVLLLSAAAPPLAEPRGLLPVIGRLDLPPLVRLDIIISIKNWPSPRVRLLPNSST